MGYRSDVGLAMYKGDFDDMIRKAADKGIDLSNLFECAETTLKETSYGSDDDNVVVTRWDWVKWYDEFADVGFVMNFIGNVASLFIRVGESSDDEIEVLYGNDEGSYDFDDYLYPVREVWVDSSGKPISAGDIRAIAATDGSSIDEPAPGSLDDLLAPAT